MWEPIQRISHGRISLRRLSLFATASLMAFFLAIFLPLSTVFAAEAQRNGTTVSYNGNLYTKLDLTATPPQLPTGLPAGTDGYVFFDTAANKAYFLLTSGPADKATSAEATTYDMTAIGSYGNHSPPQTVTIVTPPNNFATAAQGNTGTTCDSTQTAGIGWIICPVVNFLAKGMDYIYKIISNFLVVRTVTADTTSSLYRMWAIVRDIANVCFVGAFLIIIYSQITELGYSNYNLKKMLPRLIIGAILVNLSFWVCAIAVDVSNIIGYSIHDIFTNLMTNLNTAGQYNGTASVEPPSWAGLAAGVLAGTGIVAGAAIAVDTGAIFVLIPAVVMAMLSAVIALIILAARQALIICLIIISPLAFVAYLLPNTEKWFDKWRSGLLTLLFLFPIFSVIFSGAQLAGLAIIQSANGNIITIILGMTVQVAPLFITPMILKFSGGILNRVGGLVNNPNKGVVDRTRKWAQGEREHRRRQMLTASDRHLSRNPRSWNHRALNRSSDRRTRRRALQDKESDALLEGRAESDYNRRVHDGEGRVYRSQRHKNTRTHEHHATAKSYKESMEAQDEEHWQNHLYGAHGARLRTVNRAAHVARGRANVTEEAMKAANERALQDSVYNDPTLSGRKIKTVVNKGIAERLSGNIEAHGKIALENAVLADRTLRKMQIDTHEQTKRAEVAAGVLQSRADAHWGRLQVRDTGIRSQMHETAINKGVTKVMEDSITAENQRAVEIHIDRSTALKNMKIRTIRDTEVAKVISSEVDAAGQRAAQVEIEDNRSLRKKVVKTYEDQQAASTIKNTLESNAKAHWQHISRSDDDIRALRLKETSAAESAKLTEERWNTLISNIKSEGGRAPGISGPNDSMLADAIRQAGKDVRVEKMAQESAAVEEGRDFAEALKNDSNLVKKAAGIGGEAAERRVFAKAKKQAFEPIMESIKNIDDTMPHELGSDPDELIKAFTNHDTTFDQRIAYAKRMAKSGGPGNMRLREAIDFIDKEYAAGRISDDDLQGYKELILATSDAAPSGKDIEFWLTNSKDPVTGKRRTLEELANDTGVWGGVAADAFASMNVISQLKALRTMARHAPDKFIALRDNIPETVRARLKPNVVEALNHNPNDPFWSDPAKYNDPADDKHIF